MSIPSLLLTPFLLVAPQDPPPLPTTLEELAKLVDAAHRPKGPMAPVTALRSDVEMHVLDAKAADTGQVNLEVAFLLWKQKDRDRDLPLIRYQVREAGAPIVRGRDRDGYWQLYQGEPKDLRGAEFEQDLAACKKHLSLARQLVRFLDPGAVLRSLGEPSKITAEPLQLDRATKVAATTVEGLLPAFPLLRQGGEDAPARLRVWVDSANGRLLAVEATPVVDGKPAEEKAERVHLLDLRERDDLLVPHKLEHLFRGEDGRLHLQSRAVLTSLSLRPELRVEDFDRTRK